MAATAIGGVFLLRSGLRSILRYTVARDLPAPLLTLSTNHIVGENEVDKRRQALGKE